MIDLPTEILAEVCAQPESDDPRLIAADWWEAHGKPERATFVRMQLELHHRSNDECSYCSHRGTPAITTLNRGAGACECPDGYQYLARRCYALAMAAHFGQWFPSVDGRNGPPGYQAIRRGFVHALVRSATEWYRYGPSITKRHPLGQVNLLCLPRYNAVSQSPFSWRMRLSTGDPRHLDASTPYAIPCGWFRRLKKGVFHKDSTSLIRATEPERFITRYYRTQVAARADLDHTVLIWARETKPTPSQFG